MIYHPEMCINPFYGNFIKKAFKFYDIAVDQGLFLSVYQRSFYNEPNLTAIPWWTIEDTTYENQFKVCFFMIENS